MMKDVDLWAAVLGPDEKVNHRLRPGRHGWLQVARGAVALNGVALDAGDGATISQEDLLQVHATAGGEFLLFDLA